MHAVTLSGIRLWIFEAMNEPQQSNDSNRNHEEKADFQDDDTSRQTAKNKRDNNTTQVSLCICRHTVSTRTIRIHEHAYYGTCNYTRQTLKKVTYQYMQAVWKFVLQNPGKFDYNVTQKTCHI